MISLTLLTFLFLFSSLHISQSTNLIQCVSIDGQIGFVENENVEPIHVINLPQSITMNSIFHRKTGRNEKKLFQGNEKECRMGGGIFKVLRRIQRKRKQNQYPRI